MKLHSACYIQCEQNGVQTEKQLHSSKVFSEMNTCTTVPNDTYDECRNKIKLSLNDEEIETVKEQYENHLAETDNFYRLKRQDKEESRTKNSMHECLSTPLLTNRISLYKTKLWTFNLTVQGFQATSVHCIRCNEKKADRDGNQQL